jgi:hypothetical protein
MVYLALTLRRLVINKLIRHFSIFNVNKCVGSSPSATCVNVTSGIGQFLDVFNRLTYSLEDALPLCNSGYITASFILRVYLYFLEFEVYFGVCW